MALFDFLKPKKEKQTAKEADIQVEQTLQEAEQPEVEEIKYQFVSFPFSDTPPEALPLPPGLVRHNAYLQLAKPETIGLPQFRLCPIPAGKFSMGSTEYDDEQPVHTLSINSFYMAETQVSQALYKAVMGNNPAYFVGDNKPVEQVSWYAAVEFCIALNRKLNLPPCYTGSREKGYSWQPDTTGFRLPTEAEWEYAAKAGETHAFAGHPQHRQVAWIANNNNYSTIAQARKFPNRFALYDMSGQLWEWVFDQYSGDAYAQSPSENPCLLPSSGPRVLRGGSWFYIPTDARVSHRGHINPGNEWYFYGFRLVFACSFNL